MVVSLDHGQIGFQRKQIGKEVHKYKTVVKNKGKDSSESVC